MRSLWHSHLSSKAKIAFWSQKILQSWVLKKLIIDTHEHDENSYFKIWEHLEKLHQQAKKKAYLYTWYSYWYDVVRLFLLILLLQSTGIVFLRCPVKINITIKTEEDCGSRWFILPIPVMMISHGKIRVCAAAGELSEVSCCKPRRRSFKALNSQLITRNGWKFITIPNEKLQW